MVKEKCWGLHAPYLVGRFPAFGRLHTVLLSMLVVSLGLAVGEPKSLASQHRSTDFVSPSNFNFAQ